MSIVQTSHWNLETTTLEETSLKKECLQLGVVPTQQQNWVMLELAKNLYSTFVFWQMYSESKQWQKLSWHLYIQASFLEIAHDLEWQIFYQWMDCKVVLFSKTSYLKFSVEKLKKKFWLCLYCGTPQELTLLKIKKTQCELLVSGM